MYTVKAVSELTGLTPETLRAWERRHGVVAPVRDDSGRRSYDRDAVEKLARLKRLTDRGHAIRHLAQLDERGLQALERESESVAPPGELDGLRRQLMDAVREYRAQDFDRLLGLALATIDVPELVRGLLAPLLTQVGRLWAEGELDIAQERLVTSALKTRGLALLNQRERGASPRLLLATPSGERHELGLLLVALLALSARVPLHYVGPDLPAREIARIAQHLGVDVVALSIVGSQPAVPAAESLAELRALLPARVRLWAGGAQAGTATAGLEGIERFDDLGAVERALRALA